MLMIDAKKILEKNGFSVEERNGIIVGDGFTARERFETIVYYTIFGLSFTFYLDTNITDDGKLKPLAEFARPRCLDLSEMDLDAQNNEDLLRALGIDRAALSFGISSVYLDTRPDGPIDLTDKQVMQDIYKSYLTLKAYTNS